MRASASLAAHTLEDLSEADEIAMPHAEVDATLGQQRRRPASLDTRSVMWLQATAGNAAATRLLAPPPGLAVLDGHQFHGFAGWTTRGTTRGPMISSEGHCQLQLTLELEPQFPGMVQIEAPRWRGTRSTTLFQGRRTAGLVV
jgi:hypothetical protein